MISGKPTTAIVINDKYIKSDGTCGLSLRVTYLRKKKYYKLPLSLPESDFKKAIGSKPRGYYKEISLELKEYEVKATQVINSMAIFSFDKFEKHFYSDRGAQYSVGAAFDLCISELKKQERYGSAIAYQCAKNSLLKYKKDLSFFDVNKEFLMKYEKWMIENKNSKTTIGIYLRQLRAIINNAILNGQLSSDYYPFGKGQYIVPTSVNPKKALDSKEIQKLAQLDLSDNLVLKKARDYFLFMYLSNGMEMADMARLTYENVKSDSIEFFRYKTRNTRRVSKKIIVKRTDSLNRILAEWGSEKKSQSSFVFPILERGMKAEVVRLAVQNANRFVNQHMCKVGALVNIEKGLSARVARHSFATTIKRSNFGVAFISDSLGHTNIRTTENYLSAFEDETRTRAANILSDSIQPDEKGV